MRLNYTIFKKGEKYYAVIFIPKTKAKYITEQVFDKFTFDVKHAFNQQLSKEEMPDYFVAVWNSKQDEIASKSFHREDVSHLFTKIEHFSELKKIKNHPLHISHPSF